MATETRCRSSPWGYIVFRLGSVTKRFMPHIVPICFEKIQFITVNLDGRNQTICRMFGQQNNNNKEIEMKNKKMVITSIASILGLLIAALVVSSSFRRALIAFLIATGCAYSPADEYVIDHTEHDWYDDNSSGFVIDFLMEKSDDRKIGIVDSQEMLSATMAVYEESGSRYDALQTVTVWIAHSIESWNAFNSISPDESESYEDTACLFFESYDIDDFVVAINPLVWTGTVVDKKGFLRHFIHELIHYVSSQENGGDSDHNHKREKYWGKNGLLELALNRVVEKLNL